MGFILLFLFFAACIWVPALAYSSRGDRGPAIAAFTISNVVCGVIFLMAIGHSYDNYVDSRVFYDATREQYVGAIETYEDHAVIDMGAAAFTDMEFQGYQEQVGKLIVDLRKEVVDYNATITSKRIMNKNWFYSWLIIAPDDDMKIIKMKAPTAGMRE